MRSLGALASQPDPVFQSQPLSLLSTRRNPSLASRGPGDEFKLLALLTNETLTLPLIPPSYPTLQPGLVYFL